MISPGMRALNRLAKWRNILTGWQLGSRLKGDPEGDAVRDHREVTLLLRAEVNALAALLTDKGVITADEWDRQLVIEARHLDAALQKRFPGATAHDHGMELDAKLVHPWMSKFPK
jgi:hypothetical protein